MKKIVFMLLVSLNFSAFAAKPESCKVYTQNSMAKAFLQKAGFIISVKEWSANFSLDINTLSQAKIHGHCGFMPTRCSQTNTTMGILSISKISQSERRTIHSDIINERLYYQKKGNFPFPTSQFVTRRLLNSEVLSKIIEECRKI